MAITNGYLTLLALKTAVGIPAATTTHDNDLERAIEAASRSIDAYCSRRFWQDSAATAYYYTPAYPNVVPIEDCSTTTGLVVKTDENDDGTFENTWTADSKTAVYGYRLEPSNPATGHPWIALKAIGSSPWPVGIDQGVEVTMKAGWAAVPTEVVQACLGQSVRLWERRNSPFGILGTGSETPIRIGDIDPDFRHLLAPLRRFHE